MITPKKCIESFESYRKGDKGFCRLASIANDGDENNRNLGFWFEVLKNDHILVLSVRYQSLKRSIPQELRFSGKKCLENFVEETRQSISEDLEQIMNKI
jgi:hypothetical protein